MKKIKYFEPTTIAWLRWKKRCEDETKEVERCVRNGKKWKKKSKLYNGQKKQFYFKNEAPFYHKCVYCEKKLRRHDPLDHYRPAKAVTDENDNLVEFNKGSRKIKHEGYYWLCYDSKNLLPCCADCNGPIKPKEKKTGKCNRFPIAGSRAIKPNQEKKEKPLIINPVTDYPDKHLAWDEETGIIFWKTKKGEKTIELLGFYERDDLLEAWDEAFRKTQTDLATYFLPDVQDGDERRNKLEEEIKSGEAEFSLIKSAVLKKYKTTSTNM